MDELGSVADEFAQFAQRWWGDPGFGQTSQAQQVDQVRRIALVVFHPPFAPVVAQRMGQVDVCPAFFEHVSGPVPPVGGFEDHLGALTGLGQLGRQGDGVVVDADRVEGLACPVAAHDHAASPVQVDADILLLLFHGSLLLSSPGWFGNPKCALHTWSGATGGLPLALRLGSGRSGDVPRGHPMAPGARRAGPCATPVPVTQELRCAPSLLNSQRLDPHTTAGGHRNGHERCPGGSVPVGRAPDDEVRPVP